MTEGADRIGSLSVDIDANLGPLEAKQSAVLSIMEKLAKPVVIKIDSSELTAARTAITEIRDALTQVRKEAAEAGTNTTRTLKFEVDTAKIRADIENALKTPFKVNLEIGNLDEIRSKLGGVSVTVTPASGGGAVASGGPSQTTRVVPSSIQQDINNNGDLRKTLVNLYDTVDRHLQRIGQPSLGPEGADPMEKFGRLVDRFGTDLNGWIEVNNAGAARGGALSKASLTAMGMDPGQATSVQAAAKDFQAFAGRSLLFSHLRDQDTARQWRGGAPAGPSITPHERAVANLTGQTVARAVEPVVRSNRPDTTTVLGRVQTAAGNPIWPKMFQGPPGAQPLTQPLSQTLKQFIEATAEKGAVSTRRARRRETGTTTGEYVATAAPTMSAPVEAGQPPSTPLRSPRAIRADINRLVKQTKQAISELGPGADRAMEEAIIAGGDIKLKALQAELATAKERPRVPGRPGGRSPGQFGGGTAAPEVEQEAASARLQPDRRLQPRLTFQTEGGRTRDISGLARAAQFGIFSNLGRETGGGKEMVTLSPEDLQAFEKITGSGRRSMGRKAMIGGREIERLDPFKEFINQAEALYGPEARQAIEAQGPAGASLRQQISGFLGAGQRLALPAEGITYRETGQYGRQTMYGSGMGAAGTGFSEATMEASAAERQRQTSMDAATRGWAGYRQRLLEAERQHSAVSQERVAGNIGLRQTSAGLVEDPKYQLEHERLAGARKAIESGALPDPMIMFGRIMEELPKRTEGTPSIGGMLGGTHAGFRAVREIWADQIAEISNAFNLGIEPRGLGGTVKPLKQIDSMLAQAGMDFLSIPRREAYAQIGTRELFGQQDVNRMRQPGGNDRLGSTLRVQGYYRKNPETGQQEYVNKPKDILMPTAPLTPAQIESRELRAKAAGMGGEPGIRYVPYEGSLAKSEAAARALYEKGGINLPVASKLGEGYFKGRPGTLAYPIPYPSTPEGGPLRMPIAGTDVALAQGRAASEKARLQMLEEADRKLGLTRQALSFVSGITGAQFEELPATPARKRRGLALKPESPNRPDPFFRMRAMNPEDIKADRPEVLAALPGAGLEPDVEAEVRSMFQNRTLAGLLAPVRRKIRGEGATGQQMREKMLASLEGYAAGTEGEVAPVNVPFSRGSAIPPNLDTAVSMAPGGLAAAPPGGKPPTTTGAGGAGGQIHVIIDGPFPLPVSGGAEAQTFTGAASGIGGPGRTVPTPMYASSAVTPGEPGPASPAGPRGRRARGAVAGAAVVAAAAEPAAATAPSAGASSTIPEGFHLSASGQIVPDNMMGKLSIQRPPSTSRQPESMQIRMLPREVISREQREAERQGRLAQQQARPARRTPITNAQLQEMGFITDEGTVPSRLTQGLDPVVARARAQVQIARGTLPSRAISTSFIQLFENLIGGRQAPLERLASLQSRASDVEGLATRQTGLDALRRQSAAAALASRAAARAPGATPDLVKASEQLRGSFLDASKAVHENRSELVKATTDVENMRKGVVSTTDVVRNLAAGAVGGVVGGLAAGGVMAAGQAAIQTTEKVLGPLIERMTGFQNVTAQVTGTLSDAARSQANNVHAVVAQAAANAGLSKSAYGSIAALLEQRTSIEAGNKALVDQIQLYHAADNLTQGQGPIGAFFQGAGGTPGLTRSTGGVFGTQIGATPSTIESITGELPGNDIVAKTLPFFTNISDSIINALGGQKTNQAITIGQNAEQINKTLTRFNANAEKAGSDLRLVSNASDDLVRATQKNMEQQGVDYVQRRQFEAARIAVVNQRTNQPADINEFLQATGTGAAMEDPKVILETLRRQIQVQVRSIIRERDYQLQQNRADTAVSLLAQPIAPFGRGISAPNAPAWAQATVAAGQPAYSAITSSLQTRADAGMSYLEQTLKVPPGLISDLTEVGTKINEIQNRMAMRVATNFWTDYAHDVNIAKRNVSDLAGLVGASGGSALGTLERENLMLSRQSQLLSFNMQQRQINFSLASAKFLAPGQTGEERAANIKEARIRAGYEQKQLNIARAIGSNQFEITGIVNQRAFQEAKYQLSKLQRDAKLKIDLEADQQQLAALDQKRQAILADVATYEAAGNKIVAGVTSTMAQLEAQSSKFYQDLANDVITSFAAAFGNVFPSLGAGSGAGGGTGITVNLGANDPFALPPGSVRYPLNQPGSGAGGGINSVGPRNKRNASGLIGMAQSATDIGVAGEAGTEAVAIVRNPRRLSVSGGAPVYLSVNISGNTVRSEADLNALATLVTDKVIKVLGRRASQQGLRSP